MALNNVRKWRKSIGFPPYIVEEAIVLQRCQQVVGHLSYTWEDLKTLLGCQQVVGYPSYTEEEPSYTQEEVIRLLGCQQVVGDPPTEAEQLKEYFWNGVGESWKQALEPEFKSPYFLNICQDLARRVSNSEIICPSPEYVFSWTRYCRMEDVKVVIIGQDPYYQESKADGLCFSARSSGKRPDSLDKIFDALEKDGFQRPTIRELSDWAKQGVWLLNTILTVTARYAKSHEGIGWEDFTDAVIRCLCANHDGLVFMLWGKYAKKKAAIVSEFLDNHHYILKSLHPSPQCDDPGFPDCRHFSRANVLLRKQGKEEIDWMTYEIERLPPHIFANRIPEPTPGQYFYLSIHSCEVKPWTIRPPNHNQLLVESTYCTSFPHQIGQLSSDQESYSKFDFWVLVSEKVRNGNCLNKDSFSMMRHFIVLTTYVSKRQPLSLDPPRCIYAPPIEDERG